MFPVWDLVFGTHYFPRRLPDRYGVNGAPPPNTLLGQMLYPFREVTR